MSLVQDMWQFLFLIVLLFGPVPLCLSSIAVLEGGKHRTSFPECSVLLMTGWAITNMSVGLLLGTFRLFTPSAVFVSELVILVVGIAVFARVYLKRYSLFFNDLLKVSPAFNNLEVLVLGAICSVGLILMWRVLTQPIVDYDSLAYHLPVMAKWYQTSSFGMLDQFAGQINSYPYGWEVLSALFLMPLKEDLLVAFPNFMAWVIFGLSVYVLSVGLGATRLHGLIASSLVLIIPVVTRSIDTMQVDLALGSFFLVGLWCAIGYARSGSHVYLAFFLATLGLLAATKMSGLAYGAALVAALTVMEAKSRLFGRCSTNLTIVRSSGSVFLWVLIFFLFVFLGGYWYVRNFLEVGNPIGFVKVQMFNITVFPGPIEPADIGRTTLAGLFDLKSPDHWKILLEEAREYLHTPFLALVMEVLLIPLALALQRCRQRNGSLIGLVALMLGTGIIYWTTPYSGDNGTHGWQITGWIREQFRYGFPLVGVLGIGAAVGASCVRIWDEVAVAALLIIITPMVGLDSDTLYGTVVFLLGLGLLRSIGPLRVMARVEKARPVLGHVVLACVFLGLIFGTTLLARPERAVQRGKAYGGILEYIETNTGRDEVIGYLLSHRSYLFYGKDFSRRVLYVPSGDNDLGGWLRSLSEQQVSIIAVGPLRGEWRQSKEVSWLQNANGPFIRVFGQDPEKEPVLYRKKAF